MKRLRSIVHWLDGYTLWAFNPTTRSGRPDDAAT